MPLLKQNSELKKDRIWNWTLPAWVTKLDDGRTVNVCPSAGACKDLCYARNGTYRFPKVLAAHQRNLKMTLDDADEWEAAMLAELSGHKFRPTGSPRFPEIRDTLDLDAWTTRWCDDGGGAVRIHDSGDFYSEEYLAAWIRIAEQTDDVLFYAYTKEVQRVKAMMSTRPFPPNFKIVYSLGGTQDHLLDLDEDRHADVFPTLAEISGAGYTDQEDNDLLCVLLDTPRIGVSANNIPAFRNRMGGSTFGEIERSKPRNANY